MQQMMQTQNNSVSFEKMEKKNYTEDVYVPLLVKNNRTFDWSQMDNDEFDEKFMTDKSYIPLERITVNDSDDEENYDIKWVQNPERYVRELIFSILTRNSRKTVADCVYTVSLKVLTEIGVKVIQKSVIFEEVKNSDALEKIKNFVNKFLIKFGKNINKAEMKTLDILQLGLNFMSGVNEKICDNLNNLKDKIINSKPVEAVKSCFSKVWNSFKLF